MIYYYMIFVSLMSVYCSTMATFTPFFLWWCTCILHLHKFLHRFLCTNDATKPNIPKLHYIVSFHLMLFSTCLPSPYTVILRRQFLLYLSELGMFISLAAGMLQYIAWVNNEFLIKSHLSLQMIYKEDISDNVMLFTIVITRQYTDSCAYIQHTTLHDQWFLLLWDMAFTLKKTFFVPMMLPSQTFGKS